MSKKKDQVKKAMAAGHTTIPVSFAAPIGLFEDIADLADKDLRSVGQYVKATMQKHVASIQSGSQS